MAPDHEPESQVSRLLRRLEAGDRQATDDLLPLVYAELRQLAAARLSQERRGHTLPPTALVHEAYLRLVGTADAPKWQGRRHFLGAAAEAMRRILIDHARARGAQKRGGAAVRELLADRADSFIDPSQALAIDEALAKLAKAEPDAAELVKLRFFAGLSQAEAAAAMNVSVRTADRLWAYARAWLSLELG